MHKFKPVAKSKFDEKSPAVGEMADGQDPDASAETDVSAFAQFPLQILTFRNLQREFPLQKKKAQIPKQKNHHFYDFFSIFDVRQKV